jgi:hypothetical protein
MPTAPDAVRPTVAHRAVVAQNELAVVLPPYSVAVVNARLSGGDPETRELIKDSPQTDVGLRQKTDDKGKIHRVDQQFAS